MDAPRLEALTGPLKSSQFSLPVGEITVGRGEDSAIRIPHNSASREHCVFRHEPDGAILVRDLGSRNGTIVNGTRIAGECRIGAGDEIHVGVSLFVLMYPTVELPQNVVGAISGADSHFLTRSTVHAAPMTAQIIRLFDGLLKASVSLGSVSSYEEWEQALWEAVFTLTGAARAAIAQPETGPRSSAGELAGVTRKAWESRVRISLHQDLVRRAYTQDQTVLGQVGNIAVIVAPMRTAAGSGLLYLEGELFSEDELHAIAAIATIAGLAWERVSEIVQLKNENERLWSQIDHDLVGQSQAVGKVIEFIAKVAPVQANVLLLGESGTGKDLVAKAIHRNSKRARKPFIVVNCGSIPASLVESELFGHERGAFTGAVAARPGLFESAAGGTVFLDEVSELPLSTQPALLRVIQNREVRRVGGTRTIPLDFRLIAASNTDLDKLVQQGGFRVDLYHRLGVVSQRVPPLRERGDDIGILARHFVRKFATRSRPSCHGLSTKALSMLASYRWPGNVRELENAIEQAVVLGGSPLIEADDLPEPIRDAAGPRGTGLFHESVATAKRRVVQEALESSGTFVEAARILGVNVTYLHRLVTNLGLRETLRRTNGATARDPEGALELADTEEFLDR